MPDKPYQLAIDLDSADCLVCNAYGWVCASHELVACACGGAEKPCRCNPEAWLPEGFEAKIFAVPPAVNYREPDVNVVEAPDGVLDVIIRTVDQGELEALADQPRREPQRAR